MPAVADPPVQLKHWFDAARYRQIATLAAESSQGFDRRRFLALTLRGLEQRSLMDRLRQTAIALEASLPGSYRENLDVVRALAPRIGHNFVAIALCDFVARFGLEDFDRSLDALRFLTPFGSAEFAVRPFLVRDQARTLAVMESWTRDPDEHVRRLASEGCRPRLPWGQRLPALIRDPRPLEPILTALKDDPSLFVRKSVANNLNDITKDHPDWVLARLAQWDHSSPRVAWIAKRALRTLIKRGDSRALALFGAGEKPMVRVRFTGQPPRVRLGQTISLTATITSTSRATQRLVVDYVIHYIKARGVVSPKVFKWAELTLDPRATVALTKRQTLRDFTTRRHCPGRHCVELQINGHRLAATAFQLRR
jgi:3-methyladenine DNA glycosylase AlkC